jgi:hypothetical protein
VLAVGPTNFFQLLSLQPFPKSGRITRSEHPFPIVAGFSGETASLSRKRSRVQVPSLAPF